MREYPQKCVRCIVKYNWGERLENKSAIQVVGFAPSKETNNKTQGACGNYITRKVIGRNYRG